VKLHNNACLGQNVCQMHIPSSKRNPDFYMEIGENSCGGSSGGPNNQLHAQMCIFYPPSSGTAKRIHIGKNSCHQTASSAPGAYAICFWEQYTKQDAEFVVGDNSCLTSDRACNGQHVIVGHGSCNSVNVHNCMSHNYPGVASGDEPDVIVGDNSCVGAQYPCRWVDGSIGDNSCVGSGACDSNKGAGNGSCNNDDACKERTDASVPDGKCNSATGICQGSNAIVDRRLGSTLSSSTNNSIQSVPSPATTRKLIEVGFRPS